MYKLRVKGDKLNTTGERIAELRVARNLSQNELAGLLQLRGWSVHKNTISQIEQGKRTTSEIDLSLIADALHVTIYDLIQGVAENGVNLMP